MKNNSFSANTARSWTRGFKLLLAASLCISVSIQPAWADKSTANKSQNATKTTSETDSSASPKKASLTAKRAPVLDEEARKTLEAAIQKLDPQAQNSLQKLADALHEEDRTVYNELREEEESSFSNIGMLWEAAVERSSTIRYAIEKLSRRDATGKPVANDSFSKRMVASLVSLGGVAGTMWTGTPAGMIGSNMVQQLMSGNPQDSVLSRVTDADMVILAKEVENLQAKLIEVYYNYQHSKERLALTREASSTISKYYDHAIESTSTQDSASSALQPLMQSIYDSTKQDEQNSQQAYNSARTELTLLVGKEALAALDQPATSPTTQKSSGNSSDASKELSTTTPQ